MVLVRGANVEGDCGMVVAERFCFVRLMVKSMTRRFSVRRRAPEWETPGDQSSHIAEGHIISLFFIDIIPMHTAIHYVCTVL